MPTAASRQQLGPYALTRTLAWLRLCAIAGQSIAVLVCAGWMRLPIPLLALLLGIGLLAVFAVFAAWRLQQPWPVREWETVAHIGVDTLVLGYLLYFTGGASNPFITLLLVPIALSAAALSARAILAVSTSASIAYLILLFWYVPLRIPLHATFRTGGFSLHVAGMAVNFIICACCWASSSAAWPTRCVDNNWRCSGCASVPCATKASWPLPLRRQAPRTNSTRHCRPCAPCCPNCGVSARTIPRWSRI